jgi:hypothetical protein
MKASEAKVENTNTEDTEKTVCTDAVLFTHEIQNYF